MNAFDEFSAVGAYPTLNDYTRALAAIYASECTLAPALARERERMSKVVEFKLGDPCPGCGGELRKAQQPTAVERAAAANKDDPRPLPPHYDTAPLETVDEHGELWKCPTCGYPARFKAAKPPASDEKQPATGPRTRATPDKA